MKDLKEITQELERGVEEVFTDGRYEAYLDAMSRFYQYSACNCLLILRQKPDATRVASFRKWKNEFRRSVKKGEKALYVLAPVTHKNKVTRKDGTEDEIVWVSFRPVPVFDLGQTEGEPLPTLASRLTGSVSDFDGLRAKLIALAPVPVTFEDFPGDANGFFNSSERRIVIRGGMSEEQTIKTLAHEIAHSLLHGDGCEQENADRETREVQAESVAYVVCRWLGLDTASYSFGYVAGWSKGKETKTLTDSLETIRKAARVIIDGLQAAGACAA